jgi:hypothetical protein
MLFIFSTPVLIRHLWQLKTAVFLHWCLILSVLLNSMILTSRSASMSAENGQFTIANSDRDSFAFTFPQTKSKFDTNHLNETLFCVTYANIGVTSVEKASLSKCNKIEYVNY